MIAKHITELDYVRDSVGAVMLRERREARLESQYLQAMDSATSRRMTVGGARNVFSSAFAELCT